MRPLKNVIYVQTQGAWLHKDGENLVMKVENNTVARVPIHKLQGLVCFGQVSLSPFLMEHCAQNAITITLLNQYGRFLSRVEGAVSGNVFLRRSQYRLADQTATALPLAKQFMLGKLYNQRSVIRRYLRDYSEKLDSQTLADLTFAEKRLTRCLQQVPDSTEIDHLMGREGEAGAVYFDVFQHLIRQPDIQFNKRERRPPKDPVNSLLSFCYTLMTHDCRSALETTGLDPQFGFFHQLRAGRPSLALDMVEEFRPMVDRFVLSLINKRQIQPKDFEVLANQAMILKDEPRRTLLAAWQDRKQEKILHPWFEEQIPIGLLPWLQAQILARHLRGDCDTYVPFLWK